MSLSVLTGTRYQRGYFTEGRKVQPSDPGSLTEMRNATNSSFLCILFSVERLMITLPSEWANFFICLL